MVDAGRVGINGRCVTCKNAYQDEVDAIIAYYNANREDGHSPPGTHCSLYGRSSSPYSSMCQWCGSWVYNDELRPSDAVMIITFYEMANNKYDGRGNRRG